MLIYLMIISGCATLFIGGWIVGFIHGYTRRNRKGKMIEEDKNRKTEREKSGNELKWLGKNCKDCGNEKCKKLGILSKKYDCALWQARHAVLDLKGGEQE